jgi:hypothetical protein
VRALIVTVSLLAGAGCSSEADDPPPAVPLCDGSTHMTLRVFYEGGGQDYLGGAVRLENGHPSFVVDGQCQYFMSGGWLEQRQSRDVGWRQGIVPDDLRRALEDSAGMEDLTSAFGCSGAGGLDAPSVIVANTRSSVVCPGDGIGPVREAIAVIRQRARDLWAAGRPLDGDLHVNVREVTGLEPERRWPWPSELVLRDYLEPDSLVSALEHPEGQRRRVAALDAIQLRVVREQYLRDTEAGISYQAAGIPVTDGELSAALFMRDALPHEDERGILPLPGD